MERICVVTSGKGGAGKSTVTAGLGYALAKTVGRVLLIDADAGLRSLDLMLGIGDTAMFHLADVFAGRCEPIKAIYPSPVFPNVFVLPAPVALDEMCNGKELSDLCRGLAGYYDQILIDCPAGVGRGFQTAVDAAQRALIVTTPDTVCARDAQIVSSLLEQRKIPAHLLINRLRSAKILNGSMPDVDEIIDTAGVQLLGIIPEDEEVAVANANGKPLPADCNAALCFSNIAQRYLGGSVPLAKLEKM